MKEFMATLLLDFMTDCPSELIQRQINLIELAGKISVVIGMRRVGKTYSLYQRIQQLIDDGIE